MMTKTLSKTLQSAASWPEYAQAELAAYAEEIEAGLRGGVYRATEEELAGIDRGLADAREGRVVSEAAVEAIFAKYRRA
jgi:predicted transcriptional regulator